MLVFIAGAVLSGCGLFGGGRDELSGQGQQQTMESGQAHGLYEEAWRVVLEEYVDTTFNGQDWYRWKEAYKGDLRDKDDAYVGIQSMLASLDDDYTRFLKPRDMSEQTLSIDSRLFGVGIQIFVRDNKLIVVTPLKGSPAEEAGLEPGDMITHIDNEPTAGMTVEEAADKIRGPEGTPVALTIKREEKMFPVTIRRAEIKIQSVFTQKLKNPQIGYIRLNSFISENAFKEMVEALEKEKSKKALILDLRGNYGGLLNNAVDIADLFLQPGQKIVSIVDRKAETRAFQSENPPRYLKPMIVLIDGSSASASEILSGALKDNRRAKLVGAKTFGKGLVQKINHLSDGSGINITISKYYTPKGTDIDKKGIRPDYAVKLKRQDVLKNRDLQLDKAIEVLSSQSRMLAKPGA
ncbi:MAG: PDZ domain-containing protein [Vampirovibrio sp.]|nr:PDZ domain-containing protein [Vampirovibrio sp.]